MNKQLLNNRIIRIVLITGAILLIPLLAMQFSRDVVWELNDFVIAGVLIFVTGLLFELIMRKVTTTRGRLIAGGVLALAFLYIWAELAVGIFTNWGS